jgi:uncharacterized membrane protein
VTPGEAVITLGLKKNRFRIIGFLDIVALIQLMATLAG